MGKKPLIGVSALYDDERASIWMLPGYLDVITACGGLPFMFPLECEPSDVRRLAGLCDGVLLTGGHDVDPALYGMPRTSDCGEPCPPRDRLESTLIDYAVESDIPLLGICRGVQLLNVHFGGTLYQDLDTERPSGIEHHMAAPYNREQHTVEVLAGTPLASCVGVGRLSVNSIHHQAVKELAAPLSPMAVSPDGLVEALWHPGLRFAWGVQWHPEYAWRDLVGMRAVVQAFVDAASL